jgi:hypothetical protein
VEARLVVSANACGEIVGGLLLAFAALGATMGL